MSSVLTSLEEPVTPPTALEAFAYGEQIEEPRSLGFCLLSGFAQVVESGGRNACPPFAGRALSRSPHLAIGALIELVQQKSPAQMEALIRGLSADKKGTVVLRIFSASCVEVERKDTMLFPNSCPEKVASKRGSLQYSSRSA